MGKANTTYKGGKMNTPTKAANKFCKVAPKFRKLSSPRHKVQCFAKGEQDIHNTLTSLGMQPYKDHWMQDHIESYRIGNVGAHAKTYQGNTFVTFVDLTPQPLAHIPYD